MPEHFITFTYALHGFKKEKIPKAMNTIPAVLNSHQVFNFFILFYYVRQGSLFRRKVPASSSAIFIRGYPISN